MSDNIVAQLRLYAEQKKRNRSAGMKLLLSDSADEIERLRAERDEARQRICEMHIHYSNAYRKVGSQIVQCETVQEVARAYGWDCYGEQDDLPN